MRRLAKVCAALMGLALVAVGATWVGVRVTHPPDDAAYVNYLVQYGAADGTPIAVMPPTRQLLAEGHDACGWLAKQPFALWRGRASFQIPTLQTRYVDARTDRPPPWTQSLERLSVVAGAWTYLCPATLELHEPHLLRRQQRD